jgi:outer membrane protein OmpA-like peptidoglycan-associated protein
MKRGKEERVRVNWLPAAMVGLTLAGCASKSYVGQEVGGVNDKVDALSGEVERTQERVRENEVRIGEVDERSQAGISEARGAANEAMERAEAAERAAKGKIVFSVTLSNDRVTFDSNASQLTEAARRVIDEALAPYLLDNRGVFFEIEGHTDATGPEEYNKALGEQRAAAVRDYLYSQHQVALSRIAVISFGEAQPLADNDTPEGRAQNRRVVIKVLE